MRYLILYLACVLCFGVGCGVSAQHVPPPGADPIVLNLPGTAYAQTNVGSLYSFYPYLSWTNNTVPDSCSFTDTVDITYYDASSHVLRTVTGVAVYSSSSSTAVSGSFGSQTVASYSYDLSASGSLATSHDGGISYDHAGFAFTHTVHGGTVYHFHFVFVD